MSTEPDHPIIDHGGILHVAADGEKPNIEIDFDPSRLSDGEVRGLILEHAGQLAPGFMKHTYRLENSGCEACSAKLERRVTRIPGVRRASATFIGKTLSVTFDPVEEPADRIADDLRAAGAAIKPLAAADTIKQPFLRRLFAGELTAELSCALGLACLIAAKATEHATGLYAAAWALYIASYIFGGQEGVRSAIASLREKTLDVDVLMVLAAIGAALIGAPFEGALLLFLFSFSNILQDHAMQRTSRAIESLLTLRPSEALVKRGGAAVKIPIGAIAIGETVIVRPGEQIPVDGAVSEGSTSIDESSLTGESMPVSKTPGSMVFAGTLNQTGAIELTVAKLASDSTLARMVELVAEAQTEKSKTQRFLETAEQYYAMGVIALTIAVFLVGHFALGQAASMAFYTAMTVMVVASPCALIISTPATVLSAIGGAARRGILIKGGSHLERAAHIDIAAVDKTGTLTFGKPSLTDIAVSTGVHVLDTDGAVLPDYLAPVLRDAAALEAKSEHPLATAIVRAAESRGLTLPEATDFQSVTGKGAEATVGEIRYIIGSERMFHELDAQGFESLAHLSRPLQDLGKTCVWFGSRHGDDVTALAIFAMADTIRPEARHLAADLRKLGVRKVVMLTGDQPLVAQAIAREAKVDEVHAGLLPQDKLNLIRDLKRDGAVMMLGDGVNDAPALAISDLGIAMGAAGTDVAMETADVVLMGDRLENIPLLLSHARRARRVLIQNLSFASLVIVVLVIGALGFKLPLPLGVIGHEGSTVLVCLNGLRLLLLRQPK